MKDAPEDHPIVSPSERYLRYFSYVYIACAAYSIITYFPSVYEITISGNWSLNRNLVYSDEMVFINNGFFSHLSIIFSGYLGLLAFVVGFYYLTQKNSNYLGAALIVLYVLRSLSTALYTSSRGNIVCIGMLFFATAAIFWNVMTKKTRSIFVVIIVLFAIGTLPFLINISVDRFKGGYSETAEESFIRYLGIAPLAFNYGVWPINRYMYGEYAFGNLFGESVFYDGLVGGRWGTAFFTFVGWLFIDWGPLGTLTIGFIVCNFWLHYKKRNVWTIGDIYIYMVYIKVLLEGVFVLGRSHCYSIISNIFVYFAIKIIERMSCNPISAKIILTDISQQSNFCPVKERN